MRRKQAYPAHSSTLSTTTNDQDVYNYVANAYLFICHRGIVLSKALNIIYCSRPRQNTFGPPSSIKGEFIILYIDYTTEHEHRSLMQYFVVG